MRITPIVSGRHHSDKINPKIDLKKASKPTPVNSNNDWGFGGYLGKLYAFPNGLFILDAKYCYRHTGSTKFVRYQYSENGDPYPKEDITEDQFMELYSKLP